MNHLEKNLKKKTNIDDGKKKKKVLLGFITSTGKKYWILSRVKRKKKIYQLDVFINSLSTCRRRKKNLLYHS